MPCWCKRLRGGWEQKDREGMAPATAGAAIGWEGDEQVLESDGDADTRPTAVDRHGIALSGCHFRWAPLPMTDGWNKRGLH